MRSTAKAIALATLAFAGPLGLHAQDARTVTEPKVPAACVRVPAELVPVGDTTLADTDERRLDTERIQSAIDHCDTGRAVVLEASGGKRAFVAGPIRLRAGVTLVIAKGAILFASRDARQYDVRPGSCGVVNTIGKGCRPLVAADSVRGAAVMGPGTIDGRGWATLLGDTKSWWQLAEDARASYTLYQNCPRLIVTLRSDEFTVYDITLKNSPNFHVVFDRGNGFTAWGVRIDTPKTARNTDGIDPMSATNVTITRSFIRTGDDNVALKAGSNGPTTNVTISHDHFYSGHGMSIGSETNGGVHAVRVRDLSIEEADNGLRIKSNSSRGGLVEDVEYRDVCIRDTKNPIYLDTHYSASAKTSGDLAPVFRDVSFRNVRVDGGGKVTLDGYDASRRLGVTFDDLLFDTPDAIKVTAAHVDARIGPGAFNLPLSGKDVTVRGPISVIRPARPNGCGGRFVPFPTR